MKKLKIVIISYSWPPRNAISVHRPYSWARYWSEQGNDVTVLTAKKQIFDSPLDLDLPHLKNVNVIELPYYLFWSPLLKFPFIEKIGKWFKKKFSNYLEPSYDPRNYWYYSTSPIFSKIARNVDVVISTYGPEVSHSIGCKMKILNPSIYWIADYRDLWSENPGLDDAPKKLKNKIKMKEKETVGRYADLITAVSDDHCERLSKLLKKPTLKITNGFDIDEHTVKNNISKKNLKLNKKLKIVFTGNIYSKEFSPVILLNSIVNLINKKKIPKNSIVLEFYGARHDHIKNLSLKPKYQNLIQLKGHINRSKILEKQKKADILVLYLSSKDISRGVVTGKFYEYMAAARPILCIGGRPDFDIVRILKLTKIGLIFHKNNDQKLEDLICSSYYGEGIFKKYKPNKNKVLSFSRKRISKFFLSEIKKRVLKNKKGSSTKFSTILTSNKKIPKVVHIITGLEKGGAERFLYNLINKNLNNQINNTVISLMSEGYYGTLLEKKKIKVFNLNMSRGSIDFSALRKLREILIKQKPDIIQGWMYHGNLAALLGNIMVNRKLKLSWSIRLSLEIFNRMKLSTRIAIKFGSIFSRIPDSIIYNSIRSLNQHRHIGYSNSRDFFIPNGFDTDKWKPDKNLKLKLRNTLGISKSKKVIGYVGRGDDQKDLPTLFKAFDKICKTHKNIFLVAIGRNLKKYSTNNKNVIFLGQRSDIENLMKCFDLLCLSSRAEGFPNVIGEAMSTGVPCITTDVGDARDIVGKTGWVSPPNNPKSLAYCLDTALKSSRRELTNHSYIARQKIIDQFHIKDIRKQFTSLYKSMLD